MNPELIVTTHFSFFLGHTDVTLVDKEFFLGFKAAVAPDIRLFGITNHTVPGNGLRILLHPVNVQGNPL